MDLMVALANHLEEDGTLAALVGERIYPSAVPQHDEQDEGPFYPAITLLDVTGVREPVHDNADNLVRTRVQIDVWSPLDVETRSVMGAVRRALDHFRGEMGATEEEEGVEVSCLLDAVRGMGYDEESDLLRLSADFFLYSMETA